MSREDASNLRQAEAAAFFLNDGLESAELAAAYETLDERFRTIFPPKDDEPFGSFVELFDERDCIHSMPTSTSRTSRGSPSSA